MESLRVHPQTSVSSLSAFEFSGEHDEQHSSSVNSITRSDGILGDASSPPEGSANPPVNRTEDELLAQPQPHHHVFRYWIWETLCLCLAIGSLIAVVVLITRYDNQPTAEWKFLINLTTLLSLLATIFRVSLLVPITSVISQSKWDWVGGNKVRSLKDIQELDGASRGPWGALCVLPAATEGSFLIFVAALSSLLILASGPVIQQALTTVEYDRLSTGSERATVPYAHFVPLSGGYKLINQELGHGTAIPEYDLELMIQSCQANATASDNRIQANCATGNCTFPDGDPVEGGNGGVSHSTIALCHQCFNTTPLITRVDNSSMGRRIRLPNGASSNLLGIDLSVDSDLSWAASMMRVSDIRRIANATLLNVTTLIGFTRKQTQTAVTCMLYVCLRTYQTSVREGRLAEQELPSIPATPNMFKDMDEKNSSLVVVKSPCVSDNVVYSASNMSTAPDALPLSLCEMPEEGGPCRIRNISAPNACIYRHHSSFSEAMRSTLTTAFNGSCSFDNQTDCVGKLSSTTAWNLNLFDNLNGMDMAPIIELTEDYFRKFAYAVSARYRTTYGANTFLVSNKTYIRPGVAYGRAWQTVSCNSAQLPWLTLPAGLTIVTAVLLACVVVRGRSRRRIQPVWKDSLLPLILYKNRLLLTEGDTEDTDNSLQERMQQHIPLMDLNRINALADRIPVLFQWDRPPASQENGLRKRKKIEWDVDSLLQQG